MYLGYGNPNSSSLVEFSRSADLFVAYSASSAAYVYTATALGPILYNGTGFPGVSGAGYPEKKLIVMGVSIAVTTAATGDIAVGLTWGNKAPTATTVATLVSSTYPTNKQPGGSAYNTGNVNAQGFGFLPLVNVPTTAVTALNLNKAWIPLDGMFTLQAGGWLALATSAADATAIFQYSIMWAETTK